jgi:hypothetical protein
VFLYSGCINENIVYIGNHSHIDQVPKDVLDHGLERGRCIRQSKRHDEALIVAISGSECGLPFVTGLDSDEIVGALYVRRWGT